jgi:hypothetical protein
MNAVWHTTFMPTHCACTAINVARMFEIIIHTSMLVDEPFADIEIGVDMLRIVAENPTQAT